MARTERIETHGRTTWHIIEADDITTADLQPPNIQFTVEGTSMFAIDSHVKLPKTRKQRKCPLNVTSAYVAYSAAYKAVFGVLPEAFTYDKAKHFVRIGQAEGVSLMRLKEMTRMLKARIG